MTLHIYNCDNDMALANFEAGYTPPANIRAFMQERERFPLTWAAPGDGVLTSEGVVLAGSEPLRVVPLDDVLPSITELRPWGWSPAICHRLRVLGIPEHLLLSTEQLKQLRLLSSRQQAVSLLPRLVALKPGALVGESQYCQAEDEVEAALLRWKPAVLKAPWSSSGKGIRYAQGGREDTLAGWYRRILAQQGAVVVEPLYPKHTDFAMEFWSNGEGSVAYRGLSLFETHLNGAYSHNVYASEADKMQSLVQTIMQTNLHVDEVTAQGRLAQVRSALEDELSALVGTAYRGPLGVDMMVLQDGRIHPCVEINLRMTMGFAALACPSGRAVKNV